MPDENAATVVAGQADELFRLERQMQLLRHDDPERAVVVDRYNALCDELDIPSGDKDDLA